MRLCVFQGTFNPLHNAHLRVAEYIKGNFNYDKILFIPAYNPPHKIVDEALSLHRLKMTQLAVEDIDGIEVSDIEFQRKGKSYTYLTIKELYNLYDIEGKIGFIIGTDAFFYLPQWYEANKLKTMVEFILFKRCDKINENKLALLSEKGYKFNMTDMDFLDISSTEIRKRIEKRESVRDLVPQKILEYIEKNELYRKQ